MVWSSRSWGLLDAAGVGAAGVLLFLIERTRAMADESIDTSQISVDEQGRVVIDSPALAAAVRSMRKAGAGLRAPSQEPGTNISSCGNNC